MMKAVKEGVDFLKALGVSVERVEGKSQAKIPVRFGDRAQFFLAPSSPSDWRSNKNFEARVRRWMMGVE